MADLIFISYSKKDQEFVIRLADDLTSVGLTVWLDRSLDVGENWEQEIEDRLNESAKVIVILSPNAIASKWVQHEGSMAYAFKKQIFPILIENRFSRKFRERVNDRPRLPHF